MGFLDSAYDQVAEWGDDAAEFVGFGGGESGAGGAGSMVPAGSPEGAISVPGVGPVDITVQSVANPSAPITATQAALAIAQLVARTPMLQSAIKRVMGAIIRRPPTMGGQAFSPYALRCLYAELPGRYRKPLCQFLAGLDAPIGLTKTEEEAFLALLLADAFDAMDTHPDQLEND